MSRILPNWIDAYLIYTAESESPEGFHKWVGASVIAGALERQVWFDMGYFTVYPNLYVILVSPPGRCKKSTAMRIGRGILGDVPGIQFTTDSVSRERLIQDMAQAFKDGQSAMTAFASEFATMLTTSGMDMVVFLTDIYDSPGEWIHKTKSGGTNKIKQPYLNLVGGTTPAWMAKAMPLDTVGIGLTSRVIFVYEETARIRDPFPTLSKDQQELRKLLAQDLIEIQAISGQYQLTPDAKAYYTTWHRELKENESINPMDSRLSGYYERKPIHVLKLAMVTAAAIHSDPIIDLETLTSAIQMLGDTEVGMPKVFAFVGNNPLNADIEGALAVILNQPQGIKRSQLFEMFRHNVRKEDLGEVLDTLVETGHIMLRDGKYFAIGAAP